MHFNALATAALAAVVVTAHPGQDESHEVAARRDYLATTNSPRSLAHCASSIKARGLEARNVQRRAARAAALGAGGKRTTSTTPLSARDSGSVLATDHNATELGYTLATPEATLFASSANSSCILNPVVTQGPYYVAGEYVRSDIVEAQEGVPLHFEAQVLDVNTCEPVAGAFVEIWHCNSTGVYSGIVAGGNGVRTDEDNWDTTFLRGAAQTDDDGVVTFETLFPGHYLSRTNHIHTMVHLNATAQANGTLMDLSTSAVGQIFFDQELIDAVEVTAVYNTNTQPITTNEDDSIFVGEANDGVDPVMSYTLLGDDVTDGLLAWLAFGIDVTYSKSVSPAAYYYAEGGVDA